MGMAGRGVALAAFQHAHHRLGLPALAVLFSVEAGLHQAAVATGRRLVRRSTVERRNERGDLQFFAAVLMVRFGIVPGVGQRLAGSSGPYLVLVPCTGLRSCCKKAIKSLNSCGCNWRSKPFGMVETRPI
jgi:hypothetical protein